MWAQVPKIDFPLGPGEKRIFFHLLVKFAFDLPITSCCLNGLVIEFCSTGAGEYFQQVYFESAQNGFNLPAAEQLEVGSVTRIARNGGNSQMTERSIYQNKNG